MAEQVDLTAFLGHSPAHAADAEGDVNADQNQHEGEQHRAACPARHHNPLTAETDQPALPQAKWIIVFSVFGSSR